MPGIFLHSCQPSLALLILQKAVVSLSFGKLLRHMVFSSYSNHHKISLLTVSNLTTMCVMLFNSPLF